MKTLYIKDFFPKVTRLHRLRPFYQKIFFLFLRCYIHRRSFVPSTGIRDQRLLLRCNRPPERLHQILSPDRKRILPTFNIFRLSIVTRLAMARGPMPKCGLIDSPAHYAFFHALSPKSRSLHKSGISLHFHPTAEHNHNLCSARVLPLRHHKYKICFPFFNS